MPVCLTVTGFFGFAIPDILPQCGVARRESPLTPDREQFPMAFARTLRYQDSERYFGDAIALRLSI